MPRWRPAPRIVVKAIGLAWRDGRLLAAEVTDDAGRPKGYRPLGGQVEFGETWDAALRREWAEETGLAVEVSGSPLVIENLFVHHGVPGHEIVFAAAVTLPDGALPDEATRLAEHDGSAFLARWIDPGALPPGTELYPVGLMRHVRRAE